MAIENLLNQAQEQLNQAQDQLNQAQEKHQAPDQLLDRQVKLYQVRESQDMIQNIQDLKQLRQSKPGFFNDPAQYQYVRDLNDKIKALFFNNSIRSKGLVFRRIFGLLDQDDQNFIFDEKKQWLTGFISDSNKMISLSLFSILALSGMLVLTVIGKSPLIAPILLALGVLLSLNVAFKTFRNRREALKEKGDLTGEGRSEIHQRPGQPRPAQDQPSSSISASSTATTASSSTAAQQSSETRPEQ